MCEGEGDELAMSRPVWQPTKDHPITIRPTKSRVVVIIGGHKIADTRNALSLSEASYPVVQYIPISDVNQDLLRRTETTTHCPYKGDAGYFSVQTSDGDTAVDLVWEYQDPYDAVKEIAGHVAFYTDRAEITFTDT